MSNIDWFSFSKDENYYPKVVLEKFIHNVFKRSITFWEIQEIFLEWVILSFELRKFLGIDSFTSQNIRKTFFWKKYQIFKFLGERVQVPVI